MSLGICLVKIECVSLLKQNARKLGLSQCLANLASAESRTAFWLGSRPDDVLQVLEHDHLVTLPA
jgi:hypothetical protein